MIRVGFFAALVAAGVAMPASAQPGSARPDRKAVIAAARDVMQKARYATLVTIGPDGHPQARIVDPLAPDSAFTIWIGTNPLTRKVGEVKRDPRVTLMYFDARANEYVSIIGRAEGVLDASEKARHWKAEWGPFYKNGARGSDFMLLRVRPSRLEIVSPTHKLVNDSINWRPISITVP